MQRSSLYWAIALFWLSIVMSCAEWGQTLPGVQDQFDDSDAKVLAIEYLQMQAVTGDSVYDLFDMSLTRQWISGSFARMGTKWAFKDADHFLHIDTLPSDDPIFLMAYVDSTATSEIPLDYTDPPTYVLHLYAVDRFKTGVAVDVTVGGLTLNAPGNASFIPVGLASDNYHFVATLYKAKNLIHELGHLRVMLSHYCGFSQIDHIVTTDSICVMSDVCYDGTKLRSWCPGTDCGSQYDKISYEFCASCSTRIRNAYVIPGSIDQ